MKREDLRAVEGLTDAQVDAVMALAGRDSTAAHAREEQLQQQLAAAQQAQLDAAKKQLDTAKESYQSGLAGCAQGMTSLLPSMTADGLDGFLAFLSDKGYGAPQTTTAFLQDMAEYGVSLPTVSANSAEAAYLEQGISQLLPAISRLYSARESITAGRVLMMQMLPSWKKTKSCWQTAKKNFPKPDKTSKKGRNSMKTVKSNLKTVRNNSAAQKPCWREAGQPCPADRQS